VKSWLQQAGAPDVDAVRYPAGLDLGARTAPEVALSILAEIAQRRQDAPARRRDEAPASAGIAIDPVCHMEVEIATARHSADVNGHTYYFCAAQCRTSFLDDPARFLSAPR
jgi:xanthine dehydrogenase accessory factor